MSRINRAREDFYSGVICRHADLRLVVSDNRQAYAIQRKRRDRAEWCVIARKHDAKSLLAEMAISSWPELFTVAAQKLPNSPKDWALCLLSDLGPIPIALPDGRNVSELAEKMGIPLATVKQRIARGWNIERAASTEKRKIKSYPKLICGRKLIDLARDAGVTSKLVRARLNRGWTLEKALEKPW